MMTLAEAREKRGISKIHMCRKLGVSRPTYDKWEGDPYHCMTMSNFRRACKIIGVDSSDIFFDKSIK
jgi:DNA-binding XRE family transcriptional regulator